MPNMGTSALSKPCPVCGRWARRDVHANTWSCETCAVIWRVGRRHPLLPSARPRKTPLRTQRAPLRRRTRRNGGEAFAVAVYLVTFGVPIVLGLLWVIGMIVSPPQSDPAAAARTARTERSIELRDRLEATASAVPVIEWTYQHTECADGWHSPSIGTQGACSWHGGVVSVYEGSDGTTLVCTDGSPPRGRDEQVKQMTSGRWTGAFWCE